MSNNNKLKISRQQLFQIQGIALRVLRASLDGSHQLFHTKEVLNKLIYLMFLKPNPRGGHAIYCEPGMIWIGKQIYRSDETAQRVIKMLVNLDLLRIFYRRCKKRGRWQTNAYYPGTSLARIIARFVRPTPARVLPVVKNDRQVFKDEVNAIKRPALHTQLEQLTKLRNEIFGHPWEVKP